jgi:putative membrane protein
MERRLLRAITTPAMIASYVFGGLLYKAGGGAGLWLHWKLACVLGLSAFHGFLAAMRKRFAAGNYPYSALFFRIINEVPTLLLIAIIFIVVFKPF